MACFVNMIVVVIFSLFGCARGNNGAEVRATDNAEQFALLCRIYNVAKNPPIHHVDLQDPNKIVKEIDALNASFVEPNLFNETEEPGNSSNPTLKPIITREAAVAQAIISRITQKANSILEKIKRVNITERIEKVNTEFARVIFGDEGSESNLCNGALKDVTDRGEACGTSGLTSKGNRAGNNLIVDFFCLCAQRKEDGIQDACKVKVGGKGDNHGWGSGAPLGSSSMWASIKKECENLLHQHPKSTKEGYEVLSDFFTHLKSGGVYRWGSRNVEGSNRKEGMLGTSGWKNGGYGSGPVCDGKKGSNGEHGGICVYYGPETQWEEDIDWLKKLKNALETVDDINNQTATIQRDIEKLQMLQHRAEEIYETAKVISKVQNPVGLTALPNANTKRLTAYNTAWRYHLLAPWVILIL